jgi:hypothetical protein
MNLMDARNEQDKLDSQDTFVCGFGADSKHTQKA